MRKMTVTIHSPTVTLDEFGRETYDYENTINRRARAEWVNRITSTELTEGRNTVTEEARGVLVAGTRITTNDEMTAIGERWRVVGVLKIPDPENPARSWGVRVDLARGE